MTRFLDIFALIMAIPTTFYVLYAVFALLACAFGKVTVKIGWKSIIPITIFALCWAWILH